MVFFSYTREIKSRDLSKNGQSAHFGSRSCELQSIWRGKFPPVRMLGISELKMGYHTTGVEHEHLPSSTSRESGLAGRTHRHDTINEAIAISKLTLDLSYE